MQARRFSLMLVFVWVLSGCGLLNRLDVTPVAKSVEPPGQVAVYTHVQDGDQPVTDLTERSFRIYEDNQLLSPSETRQTLLDKNVVANHHVLLLLDLSTAQDPAIRRSFGRGAAGFVGTVTKNQSVSVMAFDGRSEPVAIGEYPRGTNPGPEITELTNFQIADTSRNLHGAVVKGLGALDARLMKEKKPVRVGTLVVLTTGQDRAGRWTYEGMRTVIDKSGHRVFAIGVGEKDEGFSLADLGRAGIERAESMTTVAIALEQMGLMVDRAYDGFYLLSYCSPARDGKRLLKIEVVWSDSQAEEHKGVIHDEIEARGFGPGCDPQKPPSFGAAVAPAEPVAPPAPETPPAPAEPVPAPPPAEAPPAE